MDNRVKLIAISHVPTNGGLVNPAAAVGEVARGFEVLYLLDACQSVGQMPVDVQEIGCDFLAACGRKYLRGPRGTGFLYARRSAWEQVEPPFLDLLAAEWIEPDRYVIRDDARRFETWEGYVAGRMGLGAAVEYALQWGLPAIRDRVRYLADTFRTKLSELPGAQVRDLGQERCGIVTFDIEGTTSEQIKRVLADHGINVTVSYDRYTLLDMRGRGLPDVTRASVHYYNTEDEIDRFIGVLTEHAIPSPS